MKKIFIVMLMGFAGATLAHELEPRQVITAEGHQVCVGSTDNFCSYDATEHARQAAFQNADKACINGYISFEAPKIQFSEILPLEGILLNAHVVVTLEVQCLAPGIAFETRGESGYYPPWAGNAGEDESQEKALQQAQAMCLNDKIAVRASTFSYRFEDKPGGFRLLTKTFATAKYACLSAK